VGSSAHPPFEHLSAYRDGEPVPGTRDEIRAHLTDCSVCRNDVGAFDGLKSGESFLLVNDHNPKPLNHHFQAELTGLFSWEYLEKGPEVWKVRIGRNG
jgi:hypothetical protein